jgi:hypothetical protein
MAFLPKIRMFMNKGSYIKCPAKLEFYENARFLPQNICIF